MTNFPFTKIHIHGPESEEEKREEEIDNMMKEWYQEKPDGIDHIEKKAGWESIMIMFLVFILVVVLGGVSIYFIIEGRRLPFIPESTSVAEPMNLELATPHFVDSGDTIDITVTYQNTSDVRLIDVELQMFYPDNFLFLESKPQSPYNKQQNYWRLPAIEPTSSNKLIIRGQVVGSSQEQKTIEATALYKPTNFHSTFKKTASASFTIDKSVLALTLEGPSNLLGEQEVTYTITTQNTADAPLKNIVVPIEFPSPFTVTTTSEKIDDGTWYISTLEPEQTKQLVVTGMLISVGRGDLIALKAQAGFREGGVFLLQNYATILAPVIDPDLQIGLERVGTDTIMFATALQAKLRINNMGTLNLKEWEVELQVKDEEEVLLLNTFTVQEPYTLEVMSKDEGDKKVVLINGSMEIMAGDEIEIPFSVNIIDVPFDIGALEYVVEITPMFTAKSEDLSVPVKLSGEEVDFRVER